jgi:hypothetical protein
MMATGHSLASEIRHMFLAALLNAHMQLVKRDEPVSIDQIDGGDGNDGRARITSSGRKFCAQDDAYAAGPVVLDGWSESERAAQARVAG